MKIARKEHDLWHFADDPRCDWAETFAENGSFEEQREVDSLEEVHDFCSMCKDERGVE